MKHLKEFKEFNINEQLFGAIPTEIANALGLGAGLGNSDSAEPIDLSSNSTFDDIVKEVIDNLEGGYYHPNMLKDGRVKDSRFAASGETMMGIDRKNGGDINTTPEGKQFWSIMDGQNAKDKWDHGYKGGDKEEELKKLVSKMIKPLYDKFSGDYLSKESKEIVDGNPKLMFNFIYAVWNGLGWFKKFAEEFNKKVANSKSDSADLTKFAIELRTKDPNSLISQSGKKMQKILNIA